MESAYIRYGASRFKALIIYLCLLFILTFFPHDSAASYLNVVFFDVGEGEAIFLESPSGERLLIDSGNPKTAYRIIRFFRERKIRMLDAIFITHPHPDHIGGIFSILSELGIQKIYDNGQAISDEPECEIYRWYMEAIRKDNYRPIKAGELFRYGDIKIEVLWPYAANSHDWNANSLVLKISYGNASFLFMGDANNKVEEALLDRGKDLKADVLKVGHHGASDSSSEKFIRAVAPKYAVISINEKNLRGYPSHETMQRLRKEKIKILITYSEGDIILKTDGKDILFVRQR